MGAGELLRHSLSGSGPGDMRLIHPARLHLPAYAAALRRGWSPNTTRAEAGAEELQQCEADADGLLALMDDPDGRGPPVAMPDGSRRPRIPGLRRWMWADDGDRPASTGPGHGDSPFGPFDDARFIGSISLRWVPGHAPLPPHVLGHIGYSVVPWWQRRGHGTTALAQMLDLARTMGLPKVDITTDPDNIASQKVIVRNGGVWSGRSDDAVDYGHGIVWRYAVDLGGGKG